jgi:hypothetical protein
VLVEATVLVVAPPAPDVLVPIVPVVLDVVAELVVAAPPVERWPASSPRLPHEPAKAVNPNAATIQSEAPTVTGLRCRGSFVKQRPSSEWNVDGASITPFSAPHPNAENSCEIMASGEGRGPSHPSHLIRCREGFRDRSL